MFDSKSKITGICDHSNGLYFINLLRPPPTVPQPLISYAFDAHEMISKADLAQYLHCAAFILVVSTWTQAIDAGYFATWPVLTSDLVQKHPPKSLDTAKGHLRQN